VGQVERIGNLSQRGITKVLAGADGEVDSRQLKVERKEGERKRRNAETQRTRSCADGRRNMIQKALS
jgi:hypothetical protein